MFETGRGRRLNDGRKDPIEVSQEAMGDRKSKNVKRLPRAMVTKRKAEKENKKT